MVVLIPTLNRVDKQITREKWFLDKLPYEWHYVCPERMRGQIDGPVVYTPDDLRIAGTRQFMMEQFDEQVVLDDDIRVYKRDDPELHYLHTANIDEVRELVGWMQTKLDEGYVHGGVSMRGRNHGMKPYFDENTRVIRAHFYDAATLRGEGIRFDDMVVMEDFHVTLRLLELGYTNIVNTQFAQDQQGSNIVGGCSEYRTMKVQAEGAHRLAALHDRVKIIVKQTEQQSWQGQERTDVRVAWKKAFGTKAHERKLNVA